MVKDHVIVASHPRVGLKAICPESQGKREGLKGVLLAMGAGAPVGKGDRFVQERRESLLHPRRIRLHFYAGQVFNLSGTEIVFLLLAGLVVLGPDRLPGVIRRAGRTYAEIRKTVREYEREFRETFKEPLDDMRSTVNDFKSAFGTVDTEPSPPMRPERSADPEVLEGLANDRPDVAGPSGESERDSDG